jgi:hypothetical protein
MILCQIIDYVTDIDCASQHIIVFPAQIPERLLLAILAVVVQQHITGMLVIVAHLVLYLSCHPVAAATLRVIHRSCQPWFLQKKIARLGWLKDAYQRQGGEN